MEQGTTANPNLASLERTTGKIVFFPTGVAGGDNLGVIQMVKVAFGVKTDVVMFPTDGFNIQGVQDNVSIEPVLTFEGSQFTDAVNAYLQFGTQGTDVTQSLVLAGTTTFTAKLGKTFDIGARDITNVAVTVAAVAKTLNTDYFLDPHEGLIRIPFIAAGIADAASVLVTFDKPALVRKSVTGGNALNAAGTLIYFERDGKSGTVRAEWNLPGTLSPETPGDGDPTKYKKWAMKYAVSGQWTKLNRAA
jgi:hypothetical protein